MTNTLPNVARANRLLVAAWNSGLACEPVIESSALLAAALRGRDPVLLGKDDAWRERFERLVTALREEAELNPLGRTMAHRQIVLLLRARMRAVALWNGRDRRHDHAHPAPIIILGQMRSGTTRMQRLLACDPRLTYTRTYETLTPVPMPGRVWRARSVLAGLRLLNAETMRIHPASATAADEEYGWLAFGFGAAQFEAQWRIPGFASWSEQADPSAVYDQFKALMILNAEARGECSAKPWILKAPSFLESLPALLDVFPGARLIVLNRDLDDVVASSASLVWNQMRIQSDGADKAWIGGEWLRKTTLRDARLRHALAARPDHSVVTVDYDAMSRDWRSEMRRVYAFLGLDLPSALLDRMGRWLGSAKQHLGHRYSLDDFGLSKAGMAVAG